MYAAPASSKGGGQSGGCSFFCRAAHTTWPVGMARPTARPTGRSTVRSTVSDFHEFDGVGQEGAGKKKKKSRNQRKLNRRVRGIANRNPPQDPLADRGIKTNVPLDEKETRARKARFSTLPLLSLTLKC